MSERHSAENLPENQENSLDKGKKSLFFRKIAFSHLPEMRLLFRGGKLWKKDEWRNVVEHSLVQIVAADVFSDVLGLPEEDRKRLIKVAACHDWDKRLRRAPKDFTEEERAKAQSFLDAVKPDEDLMEATDVDFLVKYKQGRATFLEKLQCYMDNTTMGSEIVPFDVRVDEVAARREDMDEDEALTKKLGGRHWDVEREVGHKVEREIFELLQAKNIDIGSPEQIPEFIRKKIEEKITE